jgi:hypothetical protein
MRLPRKVWLSLGVLAAVLAAAAGIGYAAIPDSNGTIHACMLNATGTVRLIDPSGNADDLRSHCTKLETEVKWNQQGQPGNTDSTVRHFSQFMFDGSTVTVPVVSAQGERGKLSIFCGSDPGGSHRGVGHITFATSNTSSSSEALAFISPSIPRSSLQALPAGGQATFPWADTPNDNLTFEMILEPVGFPVPPGTTEDPLLIDIHGFIQHFDFGGCNFYVFTDASEVASPMTFTP